MKLNKITLTFLFALMQHIVAFGVQQPEVIQQSIAELRNNPSKYEGKIVRITGWMDTDCRLVSRRLNIDDKNTRSILVMRPSNRNSAIYVQDNDLFEKFWKTCPRLIDPNPCKKEIEIEIEGIVEENKEIRKELYPDGTMLLGSMRVKLPEDFFKEDEALTQGWYPDGRLVIRLTRVIRIEEKYRTPPTGICTDELLSPEELLEKYRIVPELEFDLPRPELNLEIKPIDVIQPPRR